MLVAESTWGGLRFAWCEIWNQCSNIKSAIFCPGLASVQLKRESLALKKEKLEPVARQSDQSAVGEVLGNMSMAVCLSFFVFEMGKSDQYEFSDCTSFARVFV